MPQHHYRTVVRITSALGNSAGALPGTDPAAVARGSLLRSSAAAERRYGRRCGTAAEPRGRRSVCSETLRHAGLSEPALHNRERREPASPRAVRLNRHVMAAPGVGAAALQADAAGRLAAGLRARWAGDEPARFGCADRAHHEQSVSELASGADVLGAVDAGSADPSETRVGVAPLVCVSRAMRGRRADLLPHVERHGRRIAIAADTDLTAGEHRHVERPCLAWAVTDTVALVRGPRRTRRLSDVHVARAATARRS